SSTSSYSTTLEMQVSVKGCRGRPRRMFRQHRELHGPPLSRGPGHLALREGGEFLSPAEAVLPPDFAPQAVQPSLRDVARLQRAAARRGERAGDAAALLLGRRKPAATLASM